MARKKSRIAVSREKLHEIFPAINLPASYPQTIAIKCTAVVIQKETAGWGALMPALSPAEMLSMERASESTMASPVESMCTSFLFTFWEMLLVVNPLAASLWKASYSL